MQYRYRAAILGSILAVAGGAAAMPSAADSTSDYFQQCWSPSTATVTAATTWSQSGEFVAWYTCEYLHDGSRPDTVEFRNDSHYWNYEPASDGKPVAFTYDGRAWTYASMGSLIWTPEWWWGGDCGCGEGF